jgi:hypothetical protein
MGRQDGGDPTWKAAQLVLEIVESTVNSQFLWIDDPLQDPIPSWAASGPELLWGDERNAPVVRSDIARCLPVDSRKDER